MALMVMGVVNLEKKEKIMRSRDFCYWLQGYFEIAEGETEKRIGLTSKQIDMIKAHLNLVFKHEIDPSMGNEQHQAELNHIHSSDPNIQVDNQTPRC